MLMFLFFFLPAEAVRSILQSFAVSSQKAVLGVDIMGRWKAFILFWLILFQEQAGKKFFFKQSWSCLMISLWNLKKVTSLDELQQ